MTEAATRRVALAGAATLVLSAAAMPVRVRAQEPRDAEVEATVVRIDGEDVFLDLGGEQARQGLELDVYRTLEVRHPVTRRVLRDRYVIGKVRVVRPGDTLSIARVVGTAHRPLEVGDTVEGEGAPASRPSPVEPAAAAGQCPEVPCAPCAECGEGQGDPEAREVIAVWQATLGKSPEERQRLYGIFLQRNPGSRFVPAVRHEIEVLAQMQERERQLIRERAMARETRERRDVEGSVTVGPLDLVRRGDRAEIAARVEPGWDVDALLLYVRAGHDHASASYDVIRMPVDERGHARAKVPASFVAEPGFEYFVEAVRADGRGVPVAGTGTEPIRVDVVPPADEARIAPRGRSRVHVSSELVSFNGFEGNDWYLITEGDFLYRVLFHGLYGVRVGYGHFTGEGGTVEELDELGLDPRPAGFTYGYLETEIRIAELFAVMGRVTVGLGSEDDGVTRNDTGLRGGFQLRVRIGPERGTNLVLAGETIPEIGQRAFIGLTWEAIADVPMTAEVHVTDQPINSDELAVRGVFQVGYRATEQIALSARLSYQGRTIDHAGLGGGLAATFDW